MGRVGCKMEFNAEEGRDVLTIKHMLSHISIKNMIPYDSRLPQAEGSSKGSLPRHQSATSHTVSSLALKTLAPSVKKAGKRKGPNPKIHCKSCQEEFAELVCNGTKGSWVQLSISREKTEGRSNRKSCGQCRKGTDASKLVCRLVPAWKC